MRATIFRRLEALEDEERSRQRQEEELLCAALIQIWKYVLAYYVGQLEPEGDRVSAAEERALGPGSSNMLDVADWQKRYQQAYRRLFAACGLDFDQASRRELFDEFVGLVDRLPDRWLSELKAELQGPYCYNGKMPAGANLPPQVSCDNFLIFV